MDLQIAPQKVVEAYGSLKAWAKRIDVPYTTVIGWRDAGCVPKWRHDHVKAIAEQDGKDIFAKPKAPKRQRKQAA